MGEQLRVLVVDDDHLMARTLCDILWAKGYRAVAAHSGRQAIRALESDKCDCLLTDIRMPDLDGMQLVSAVKRIEPEPSVIVMTAYSSDNSVQQALTEGGLVVLDKPLDLDNLLDILGQVRRGDQDKPVSTTSYDPASEPRGGK